MPEADVVTLCPMFWGTLQQARYGTDTLTGGYFCMPIFSTLQ